MEYKCQHCSADLDEGDILEHFLEKYGDYTKAKETASHYGWTETNKIHFDRSVIIQCKIGPQYVICPDCGKKDPFPQKSKQIAFICKV